jgi:hypothetical protein
MLATAEKAENQSRTSLKFQLRMIEKHTTVLTDSPRE